MTKTTQELIQIAVAGEGMRINARNRTNNELVKIATASKGCVVFDFGES